MDQGHAGLGEGRERVDWVSRPGERGAVVGKAVELLHLGPVAGAPLPLPAGGHAPRPTADVTHAGVAVDHAHLVGMVGGEAVGVEAAAGDADQGRPGAEPAADELVMEAGKLRDGGRRAEAVADVEEGMVEAAGHERRRRAALREGIGEHQAPAPGISGKRSLGDNDPGFGPFELEAPAGVAMPLVDRGPGEVEVGGAGAGGCQQAEHGDGQKKRAAVHGRFRGPLAEGRAFVSRCRRGAGAGHRRGGRGSFVARRARRRRATQTRPDPGRGRGLRAGGQ